MNSAPRPLLADAAGAPLLRTTILDEQGACPRVLVEISRNGVWAPLHTVEGWPTVAMGPRGSVAGQVSCAEHLNGLFIDEAFFAVTEPELAVGLGGWLDGDTVAFMAQDLGAPQVPLVYRRGPEAWGPVASGCRDVEETAAGMILDGQAHSVVIKADLNEDGFVEHIVAVPDSCGGSSAICSRLVLSPCPSGQQRVIGELEDQDGLSLGVESFGGYRDIVARTHWMDGDGTVTASQMVFRWNGLRYEQAPAAP